MATKMKTLFEPGKLECTPAVLEVVPRVKILSALKRHVVGDWGDRPDEDVIMNMWSVEKGFSVFSAYLSYDDTEFWIITAGDRGSTQVLLPYEY